MARTKTYRSKLYAKYSTRIQKGDETITVDFVNGFRVGGTLNGGMLTTSDESLQEAIEATDKFKRGDIYCSFDSGNVADKPTVKTVEPPKTPIAPELPEATKAPELPIDEVKLPAETPVVETPTDPIAPIAPTAPTVKVIETVKTRQEARMYFRDAGEQGMTPTLSFDTISKLALKYNVQFPNLK